MDVAVTGAAGQVGNVAVDVIEEDHTVSRLDVAYPAEDERYLDIMDLDAVREAFHGQDVVVHLAADPSPWAAWDDVLETNIDGTHNVFEAARLESVERVIFASSNHVQHMYNIGEPDDPETQREDANKVDADEPYRPDSFYAVSKVTGEALGSLYADRHGLEVVNMRIGWLLARDELREKQAEDEAVARYARAKWLSHRDFSNVIRLLMDADLPANPFTFNLRSDNAEGDLSIRRLRQDLGYEPKDDSDVVV